MISSDLPLVRLRRLVLELDFCITREASVARLPAVDVGGPSDMHDPGVPDLMTDWPVHARIDGPIVMIGFGSIGKGTLPLIERHFSYDRERFVVIDPDDSDRKILDARGIRFIHQAVTRENYRELLVPLLTAGGGRGFCVNLSVDTSSVAIMELRPRGRRLLHRHRDRAMARLLFRRQARPRGALQLRAARDPAGGAPAQSRRHHGGVVLRRQSRHGVVVRQAGAASTSPAISAIDAAEPAKPRRIGAGSP